MARTWSEIAQEQQPDKPEVELKMGEHLAYDNHDKVWKVWGRDKNGVYARTLT